MGSHTTPIAQGSTKRILFLTGILNVFWEELIGTKLAKGSFRVRSHCKANSGILNHSVKEEKQGHLAHATLASGSGTLLSSTNESQYKDYTTDARKERNHVMRQNFIHCGGNIKKVTHYFPKVYAPLQDNI